MKNTFLSIALVLLSLFCQAQEKSTNESSSKLRYVVKAKLGISQLELLNHSLLNGNITQIDFLLSSRISDKYRLEYGVGFSQFNGNDIYKSEYVDVKNNNLRLPISLMYNRDFNKDVSLLFGIGVYGTYYAKTGIKGYFEGIGAGVNMGASIQMGASFKISEDHYFRLLAEVQRDLTKINKSDTIEFRERMNALLGVNFVFKF